MYANQQNKQNMKVQDGNNGKDDPNDKDHSLIHLIRKFLDTRTETVLTFAAAVAIASAFKDLILSIITNIIHPIVVKLILLTSINNYVNISILNTSQNIVTNLSQFIINVLSFILVLLITYYLFHTIINSS